DRFPISDVDYIKSSRVQEIAETVHHSRRHQVRISLARHTFRQIQSEAGRAATCIQRRKICPLVAPIAITGAGSCGGRRTTTSGSSTQTILSHSECSKRDLFAELAR